MIELNGMMGDAGEGAAETAQEGKRGAEGKGPEKKKIKKQKRCAE